MLFVFIPRVSLRLPWAMCLLGLQPTLPKSETLVKNMYEITDVIRGYLFVRLRLRNVQTGVTRDWRYWDDLEEWLCEDYGVKDLKGVVLKELPRYGDWV